MTADEFHKLDRDAKVDWAFNAKDSDVQSVRDEIRATFAGNDPANNHTREARDHEVVTAIRDAEARALAKADALATETRRQYMADYYARRTQ
jgi:hypothetical protein